MGTLLVGEVGGPSFPSVRPTAIGSETAEGFPALAANP